MLYSNDWFFALRYSSVAPNPELNSTLVNSGSIFIDDSTGYFNDSNYDHSATTPVMTIPTPTMVVPT